MSLFRLVAACDRRQEKISIGASTGGDHESFMARVLVYTGWQGVWAGERTKIVTTADRIVELYQDVTDEAVMAYRRSTAGRRDAPPDRAPAASKAAPIVIEAVLIEDD